MREECSWLPGPGNRFGLAKEQINLGVSVGGSWLRMQGRALCFAQGAPLRKLWRGILPPSVSNLLSSSLGSWRGVSTPLMEISEETFLKVLPLPVRPTCLGWWMRNPFGICPQGFEPPLLSQGTSKQSNILQAAMRACQIAPYLCINHTRSSDSDGKYIMLFLGF